MVSWRTALIPWSWNQALVEDHEEMIRVGNDPSSASTSSMTVMMMQRTRITTKAKATSQKRNQPSSTRLLLATVSIPALSNMELQCRNRMQMRGRTGQAHVNFDILIFFMLSKREYSLVSMHHHKDEQPHNNQHAFVLQMRNGVEVLCQKMNFKW